jgi:hypothetical protein
MTREEMDVLPVIQAQIEADSPNSYVLATVKKRKEEIL